MKKNSQAVHTLGGILFLLIVSVATSSAQNHKVKFPSQINSINFEAQNNLRYFKLPPRVEKHDPIFDRSTVSSAKTFCCSSEVLRQQNQSNTSNQSSAYVRPSQKERARRYVNRVIGPITLLGTAALVGINHATDSPEEWENDIKGYARRFGSSLGRNAIEETLIYGLDETFRLDSTYYKKGKKAPFKERLANALLASVTARKPSGKRVVGFPRIIGVYAGSIIAFETWYPNRFTYKDGLRSGTLSLGFTAALNILREFVFPGK